MSKLRIYGIARTRAFRALWIAEELGLDYEHVPVEIGAAGARKPDYLAINPNGRLPAIEDDGFILWESLAITLYLAKKHGRLYPTTLEGEAQVWRWSLWAQGELEPWLQRETRETATASTVAELVRPAIQRGMTTLERALSGREWLVVGGFTVADLNVACVLSPSRADHIDLAPYPQVAAWLRRCYARPAAVAARARHAEEKT